MSHDLFLQGWSFQRSNKIRKAVKCYEEAMEAGDKCAVFQWNCMDRYGQSIPINARNQMDWDVFILNDEEFECLYGCYKDIDEPEIQYNLGLLYDCHKNHDPAHHYYELAVQKQYPPALYYLGLYHTNLKQYETAVTYYKLGASKNYHRSLYSLGLSYTHGTGTEKDPVEAFRCFILAANQGNTSAQYYLGRMYETGTVVKQNYQTAFEYYTSTSSLEPCAQASLGYFYANGFHVTQDYTEAVRWYQRACDQGDDMGLNNLGVLYKKGLGVPKSYTKAIELFRLAIAEDNKNAPSNLINILSLESKISKSLHTYITTTEYEGISYLFFANFLKYLTETHNTSDWDDPLLRSWVTNALITYIEELISEFPKETLDEWFQEFYGLEA